MVMEWKKAKNILIIMFLMIDVFLLGLNFFQSPKSNGDYEQLNTMLLKNNIQLSENVSLKNKKNVFVYEFYFSDVKEELKKTLLGEYFKTEKNEFVSKNKKATLSINGNKISYFNTNPNFDGFGKVKEKNVQKKLKPYLKMLGIEKYAKFDKVVYADGEYTVTYNFFVDNNQLFSSSLEFVVSEKGIHKILGNLNVPDKAKGYKFELSNLETILVSFSQNVNFSDVTKITEITYGYFISEYENAVVSQALPVYMIKASGNTYIYDARDGVDSSQRSLFEAKK